MKVKKSEKILIVDDDPNILELLRVNLEKKGYRVFTAQNGKEAIKKLNIAPELIVLDIMMPEIDGWEVCKTARDRIKLKKTKIIILTAKAGDRDKMIGVDILKADSYMTKPFDMNRLIKNIEELTDD